jgi:hypothetical protein
VVVVVDGGWTLSSVVVVVCGGSVVTTGGTVVAVAPAISVTTDLTAGTTTEEDPWGRVSSEIGFVAGEVVGGVIDDGTVIGDGSTIALGSEPALEDIDAKPTMAAPIETKRITAPATHHGVVRAIVLSSPMPLSCPTAERDRYRPI